MLKSAVGIFNCKMLTLLLFALTEFMELLNFVYRIYILYILMGACGLADQCWVHKQKAVGSSPITVKVMCSWISHFNICTPVDPGVKMGIDNAEKVTGSLWRRCSKPHTTENEAKWIWSNSFREGDGHPYLCSQVDSSPFSPYIAMEYQKQLNICQYCFSGVIKLFSLKMTMICFSIHWQPWCAFWQKNDMVFRLKLLTYL